MTQQSGLILVVEDNQVNQLAMKALLSRLGYNFELAANGWEAVEAFKLGRHSLILMDLNMPVMDGFEATRQIRALEFGSANHIPVIAVTALPHEAKAECIASGIDDFVQKPINCNILKQKLDEWLKENGATPKFLAEYSSAEIELILETFLNVTENLLIELEAGICKRDLQLVNRIAYELKGSSLQVSANEIAQLCISLEQAKQCDDWTEILRVYAALALAFTRVKAFVSEKRYQSLTISL